MANQIISRTAGGGGSPPYVVRSQTNQRENNEDSFLVFTLSPVVGQPPLYFLAIADGMGGHAYGEHVSREALRKVSLSLFEQLSVEPHLNRLAAPEPVSTATLAAVMWNTVQQTNHHVRRMIETNGWDKAGTTLVLAAIWGREAVVANLGDSPLFHYSPSTGRLRQITADHTVAGALLRANMITDDMARHHEGRSRLEFFLGAERIPPEPAIEQLPLTAGDLLLLCSDGVSGGLEPAQMETILADPSGNLAAIADGLLAAALDAGETDNQTLILWRQAGLSRQELASQPTLVAETIPVNAAPTLVDGADRMRS